MILFACMKEIVHVPVSFRCNKIKIVKLVKRLVNEFKLVIIEGLEGAIIVVMDISLLLQSEGVCKIVNVETSYDLVGCKDTNNAQNRAKISISVCKTIDDSERI